MPGFLPKITLSRKQIIALLAVLLSLGVVLWPPPPVAFRQGTLYIQSGSRLWPVNVEIAETPGQQQRGLMYRDKLDFDHGMLFLFSKSREVSMWMKDTKIPLDILFIDSDGNIVQIVYKAKQMSAAEIRSRQPVNAVLELPAGSVKSYGLRVGDTVMYHTLVAK